LLKNIRADSKSFSVTIKKCLFLFKVLIFSYSWKNKNAQPIDISSLWFDIITSMNKKISEINRKAWNQIVSDGKVIHTSLGESENELLNLLIKNVPNNGNVLDLGCGTGIPISKIMYDSKLKVTGVDVSDKMIKSFKDNLPKASAYRMPMTEINWENKFDGIVSSYSLLCLPLDEFSLMAGKITRALKIGGYFLLFLNEGDSKEGQVQKVQGELMFSTGVSEKEIRDIFEPKGMEIIRLERERCESKEYGVEHEMMFLMNKTRIG
jgi:ubiquinone/menaquinone biosynthesis C-methylase UbiE